MTQTNRIDCVDVGIHGRIVWFSQKSDTIDGHAALAEWLEITEKEGEED